MEHVDTLVFARWVLPVEPDARVLHDHAIAIRNGRIAAVLPAAAARARFLAGVEVERPTHALLPGLVNAHTRAATVLLRGRAAARWPDPEFVRDGTELALAELLRNGVTCFADAPHWPDVVARTAAEHHVRVSVGLLVADAPSAWAAGLDEYIEQGIRLHDEYKGDPLVATHLAPQGVASLADATLVRVRRLADELDLPLAVALHESPAAVERGQREHGLRPLARLARLGLVSPLLAARHFTQVTDADVDTLAERGASVVHCPRSNLRRGRGTCPAPRLLGRGIRVALGTDDAIANPTLDLLEEARSAGLLAAGVSAAPGVVVASDLLRMATLEGARTLGLGEVTGSLVPGKWADLCAVDLRSPGSWPVHEVPAALVFGAGSRAVRDVWVAGRRLLADGELTALDEQAAMDRAEAWRQRLGPDQDPPLSDADDTA